MLTSSIAKHIAFVSLFSFILVLGKYLVNILAGAYIFIIERKRIPHIKWYKKIWFCITFPLFSVIGNLSMIIALFKKVEWKPIPHNVAIGMDEINKQKGNKK